MAGFWPVLLDLPRATSCSAVLSTAVLIARASPPSVAQAIVIAKVANSRTVLLRAARDHSKGAGARAVTDAADYLRRILRSLDGESPLDVVRGREGEAARACFSVFDHLITSQKDDFQFRQRTRRPPLDNVNSLLSFVYTLLLHDVTAALETAGLDPAVGYLHRDRPGRPGLALDLMEELRAFIADRLALSLINRQQVGPGGFETTETGAVLMDDDTRKAILVACQQRKQEEILHPFADEKAPIGLIPHVQAMLFGRFLRGEFDGYPPFLWR